MPILGYERVRAAREGASSLGLEAQRQAIEGFVAQRKATLIARFTEIESGRNPERPELGKTLHLDRRDHGAGGGGRARGGLQANEGGAGGGAEPRCAARQPERRSGA